MKRFLGLIVLVAVASALPTPEDKKLEDIFMPFMSSIMLPLTAEGTAKMIEASPITNVMVPSPQLRPVMITGGEMSPKVEEALEMKDDPVIMEDEPNLEILPEIPVMEKEEPRIEEVMPEIPMEEIKKPSLPQKVVSFIKFPNLANLLPSWTANWPNWSNILPSSWTSSIPLLTPSRAVYAPGNYVLIQNPTAAPL